MAGHDMAGDELPEGILSIGDALTIRQRRRFKPGAVLCGRYKILGELGQGGMGVVFRCLDEVAGIEVAVKMLPPEVSHDTGEMEEVRENFQLVAKLAHPSIATVRTLEREPATGEFLLVMDYAPGANLRQWRKERARSQRSEVRDQKAGGGERAAGGGIALERVLPILRQIAEALDYAHQQKVIHRDIKPSNVMVGPDGSVRILDFGLAAQIHTSYSRVSKAAYGTSGTGPYMAPEQWRGEYQDAATDQYALGVMAYELLAGHLPFDSHDPAVLREAVLKSAPLRPPGLADAAWVALKRSLVKMREGRFPTCTALVEGLAGKSFDPPAYRLPAQEGAPARSSSPAKRIVGAAALAAVLLLACGGGWWWWRERREPVYPVVVLASADAARAMALAKQAESALAAGDVQAAGRALADLESLDPGRAGHLYRELSRRLTKDDVAAASAEAQRRHDDDFPAWQRDPEGLETLLQHFESAWNAGPLSTRDRERLPGFQKAHGVLCAARSIDAALALRLAARQARDEAEQARAAAREAGADTLATAWGPSEEARAAAGQAYQRADFAAAQASFAGLKGRYIVALAQARAARNAQAYRTARTSYDLALAAVTNRPMVEQYGGAAWQAAQSAYAQAVASDKDPEKGAALFREAVAKLREAVTAAQRARLAADEKSLRDMLAIDVAACEALVRQSQTTTTYIKDRAANRFEAWQRAAAAGDPWGAFFTAKCYDEGLAVSRDEAAAVAWYRRAAEKGHAFSQVNLSRMLEDGRGVARNLPEAVAWCRKAAEQGYWMGQRNLGILYREGRGVVRSDSEAVSWFRKAAEQGAAMAQVDLGVMYAGGRGVAKDMREAAEWYRKAADQGFARGQWNLGLLYRDGGGVTQSDGEAVRLLRLAAQQGDPDAQVDLGWMVERGRGCAKDPREAVDWYRKAADQGHVVGQRNLGAVYRSGIGVMRNDAQAAYWYRKAAEQGDAVAQSILGSMCRDGVGTLQDDDEAVRLFRLAANQGDSDGQVNLGWMCERGRGVPQSRSEAIGWYQRAADQGNEVARNNLKILGVR